MGVVLDPNLKFNGQGSRKKVDKSYSKSKE